MTDVTKELVTLDLKSVANMGMKHVDPTDIRPPQVLLVQKLSDTSEMESVDGETPKDGQYFDTGSRKILKEFNCYFVFAKKSYYTDKRKPEDGEKPMYQVVGVMKDSGKMFGMLLRSSASYSLNSLFTAAKSQEIPMFAFNCKVETKELSNDQGSWYIPVVRVGEVETDKEVLNTLYLTAKKFDDRAESIDDIKESAKEALGAEEVEDINDDIPF